MSKQTSLIGDRPKLFRRLALLTLLALSAFGALLAADQPRAAAQRKPYDRGNCYQWKGCKGDSIGNMWVHAPEFCATLGGKSWMDENLKCHNLPDGPRGTEAR